MNLHSPVNRRCRARRSGLNLRSALPLLCALLGIVFGPAALGQNNGNGNGQGNDGLSTRQRDELAYHTYVLVRADAPIALRRRAAERLLAMNVAPAHKALDEALRGNDAELRAAILEAIEATDVPPPALLDSILAAYPKLEPIRLERAAVVLGRFGEPAAKRVTDLALDKETDASLRLRLVQSLGFFRSAETATIAAGALVAIVNPERQEPDNITDAAFNALRRLTNIKFGQSTYEFWSAWWERNGSQPAAEWLPAVALEANEQRAALERQVQELQRRLDELERLAESRRKRLEEAINQVYFILSDQSNEKKLEALATWLDEPLITVRRVAMQRIDGLVRNNEPVGEAVTTKLTGRLKDSEKELRLLAAQLLDALNHPRLGALLAEAIPSEQDPANTARFIEILKRRPAKEAVPVLIPLFGNAAQSDAAGQALVAHLDAGLCTDEERAAILAAIEPAFDSKPTATVVRLFARTTAPDQLSRLEPLLTHEAEPMRRAAAESLVQRNAGRQALVDHHADPAIFPFAVSSLARAGTLAAFNNLFAMNPPATALRETWLNGMRELCAKLTIADLTQVDARLFEAPADRFPGNDKAQLRESLLQRVASTAPGEVTAEHAALLVRLARVRLALNRPDAAIEALDRANGQAASNEHQALRFEALMQLARYDEAARVFADPGVWISLLVRFIDQRPDTARAIATEIERRFPDLNGDAKTAFDAARARIQPAETNLNDGGGTGGGGAGG